MVTQKRLRKDFTYCPETGFFTSNWSKGRYTQGEVCGFLPLKGTMVLGIVIDGVSYKQCRLAFLYMTGDIPMHVDYVNGEPMDNSWSNLRAVTSQQNSFKRGAVQSLVGIKGIDIVYRKNIPRYRARVGTSSGKRKSKEFSFRMFTSQSHALEAAKAWVKKTREEHHGEYTNHG